MNEHLQDALLLEFIEGQLDERSAVEVALHIDACPLCANRAVILDPLSSAFAAVQDPSPPPELAERMREVVTLAHQEPTLTTGPWLGFGMLVVAAVLLLSAGEPIHLLKQLFTTLYALGVGLSVMVRTLPDIELLLPVVASMVLFSTIFAVHIMGLNRQVG